jgi:hypothetical protein
MSEADSARRAVPFSVHFARDASVQARIAALALVACVIGSDANLAYAATLLAEFSVKDTIVRGGSIPDSVPFRFRAYEPFPQVYFSWERNYGPTDVGTTFSAPLEVVRGANEAIKSATATFDLTIASISFTQWQLRNPSCDINRCLQVFVTNPAGHTITSVERIIDQLMLTGNPPGEQYVVDAKERIRLWGEPIPEPQTFRLFLIGLFCAIMAFAIRHR